MDNCEKCPRSANIASEPETEEGEYERKLKVVKHVAVVKYTYYIPVIHSRIPPKDIQPPV